MNKNLPKVFLGVVISSMIVIGISAKVNEPKFEIIDISGKKENIGNVKIVSQSYEGIYTNHKNILSKDGFEVNAYTNTIRETIENEDLIKLDEEFMGDYYDVNMMFKTGDILGFINNEYNYKENSDTTIGYNLKTKNMKTKEENMYNFVSPHTFKENSNFENANQVLVDGNDIYLAELIVEDIEYDRNGVYDRYGDSYVNIYKLDLNKNELVKYNEINSKDTEDDITFSRDILFNYGNKFYFTVNKKLDSYICYYDLDKNEFSYINESLNLLKETTNTHQNYDLYKYSINDDVLQIVSNDNKNNNSMEIKQTSIDLRNNKVLSVNNIYNVERLYKKSAINSVRSIDGKLYVIVSNINPSRKEKDTVNSIIVLDEKTKNLLYMGQYKEDQQSYSGHLIVKDNEI